MTLECETFMEFYTRPSCAGSAIQADVNGTLHRGHCRPGLEDSYRHSVSGTHRQPRPPTLGPSTQAAEAAGWGQHPSGTVTIRHRASAPLDLQCQRAIYSWYMSPYRRHHWGKTENGFLDHKDGHFSLKMASRYIFFFLHPASTPSNGQHSVNTSKGNWSKRWQSGLAAGAARQGQTPVHEPSKTRRWCESVQRICFTAVWR